ncbi:MAG: leucyl/phenylalanyl-tRNA--protein transferase [Luteimonas sp.]
MAAPIPWLGQDPDAPFPPASTARRHPDGLLAAGGDLSPRRLLNAYRKGIFPWFSEGQPILWWSPDPRTVFDTRAVRLSRRFRRQLRGLSWHVCADTAFEAVVLACARTPRPGQAGTWITTDMCEAYCRLHRSGHAHSIEVFDGATLVGGIYGVAIGRMFFGESMFSGRPGGSKIALSALARRLAEWQWPLIDAQVESAHLLSMGARSWPRRTFLEAVGELTSIREAAGAWTERFGQWSVRVLSD